MSNPTSPVKIWRRTMEAALQYEKYAGRYLQTPWASDLLDAVAPVLGERLLDVACGTGVVTRLAVERVGDTGRITGVDLHPGMLSIAERVAREKALKLNLAEGDAACLPLGDSEFDVVVCQQGLQFFLEREEALREMQRVLVPEGRLGIIVWSGLAKNPYFDALASAVGKYIEPEAGAQLRGSFTLADAGEVRRLLMDAGFKSVEVSGREKAVLLPELAGFIPQHLLGTSLSEAFKAIGEEQRAGIIHDVTAAMKSYGTPGGATVPFATNLALAAKGR